MTNTKTKTFWEHLLRAILETCDLWDICSECSEDMTLQKKDKYKKDKYKDKDNDKDILRTPKSNPRDLWLVTCDIWDTDYNSDNWEPEFICDLTFKSDTGQHSQFLQCFIERLYVCTQERSPGSFEKTKVCGGREFRFGQTGFFKKPYFEYRVLHVQSELYHHSCLYIDHKYGMYFFCCPSFYNIWV